MARKTARRSTAKEITVVPPDGATASRTRGLRLGDPSFGRTRHPPLAERLRAAAASVLGEAEGDLVYAVLEGIKRKTIPAAAGRLVLERLLPPGRPIRLDLPRINSVLALRVANDLIFDALNDGRITAGEAHALQEVALQALRAGSEAEPPGSAADVPAEERRRIICEEAERLGMVWPHETS